MPEDDYKDTELITLEYDGGKANDASLYLEDYATSLAGLRQLIQTLTAIVLQSNAETARYRPDQLIRVEVRSEREGSWVLTVVLGLASSIVGAAIYDTLKEAGWDGPRLVRWFGDVSRRHTKVKQDTLDVDAIAAALAKLAEESGLTLDPVSALPLEEQLELHPSDTDSTEPEDTASRPPVSRRRNVVDAIDQALKALVTPIGRSCATLRVTAERVGDLLRFGVAEKLIIDQPLLLLPTERDWREARIRFVRINRKTGRALMFFENDPAGEENTYYSIIIDPAVREASNVYTEAFSKDLPLEVYVRHAPPERGRIRTMWEVTQEKPEDEDLFQAR